MSFPACLTPDDMKAFDALDLLPLRQRVSAVEPASTFRGQARLDMLSRPDRFRILRHGAEGRILARDGAALAEAQRVLRQAYGASISFGTPTAHGGTDHPSQRPAHGTDLDVRLTLGTGSVLLAWGGWMLLA